MANYNDLITAIDSVIKTNNRREITGQLLQNVLNTMVGSLGENYQLAGFATPTTNPHQPDQNVFYVASQAGVYTQFDNIVLGDGISFLMWKNGAWTSQTIANVTQSWVQQNFVSKEWFRKVFRVYDEDGLEIVPNDMDSVVDNIKAMVGLWTNEYLSALGMGRDGGGSTQTLAQLNDVQLGTLANGDALVYNSAIHKWENKQIQTGVDMSVVWAALAANTNEQINASHLATALSSYVTSANLSTMLNDYATKAWAGQNFITVEWFDKLFQLYNGTEAEANKIAPNGVLPVDQTQLNIEAMFGFWTKKYISALGQGDDGTSYTTLAQLNDVSLSNPTANQVLSYNGTHWVNRSIELGSQTLADLTDVVITSPASNQMLGYDATTQKWKNIAIPATGVTSVALSMPTGFSITGSPITSSGTFTVAFASGYSLPTTAKQSNWDTAYGWGDHASAGYVKSSGVTSVATGTGLTGGTITSSGTISIDSTYQTYISHGESAYNSLGNYLPLSGGTMNSGASIILTGTPSIGDDKFGIGKGIIQGDCPITIAGDTDGSLDEYVVITSGYSKANALRVNGLAIGYNKLYWKNNEIAIKNDLSSYLPLSGGTMTGVISFSDSYLSGKHNINFGGGEFLDNNGNIHLGANSSYWCVVNNGNDEVIRFYNNKSVDFFGNVNIGSSNGSYIQVGAIRLVYDSSNNALKVIHSNGGNASLYATGGISALGAGQESGSGGSYLSLSGGTMTGAIQFNTNISGGTIRFMNGEHFDGYANIYLASASSSWNLFDNGGNIFFTANKNGDIDVYNKINLKTNGEYFDEYGNFYFSSTSGAWSVRNDDGSIYLIVRKNGNTGIGVVVPSYKLQVNGQVGATGFANTSDIRKKNRIKDVDLRIDQIAKAPAFEYYWLDASIDRDLHVGTSAQYWESVLPQVVTTANDEMGTKAMQYGVAALISAITVARKVMTHEKKIALLETRVSALEKENGEQEQLINSLQEELAKFKTA